MTNSFPGDRTIVAWYSDPAGGIPKDLVNADAPLSIKEEARAGEEPAYYLQWSDGTGNTRTIEPPLTLHGDRLRGFQSSVNGTGLAEVTAQFGLIVFLSNIVDGNVGAIIAEANPNREEPPAHPRSHGLRGWLRRLLHRLDTLLAEA